MLELLLSFTVATVTDLGGALGTARGWETAFVSFHQHTDTWHNEVYTKKKQVSENNLNCKNYIAPDKNDDIQYKPQVRKHESAL